MSDEKEAWQQIVASFDKPPAGEQPWPDIENVPTEDDEAAGGVAIAEPEDESGGESQPRAEDRAENAAVQAEDDPEPVIDPDLIVDPEGHYEPPAPPPLPRLDPITKIAWIALFGGPIYLLLSVVFGWRLPSWLAFAAVAAFIGGFITLIMRMGDGDSGPGDGAVV